MARPCALYRHFAADGSLLYVGISLSAITRLAQHLDASTWADEIVRVEIERYVSVDAARAAERAAIKSERPKHNIADTDRNLAVSLSDRIGRERLALALGLSKFSIRAARAAGVFPATWFLIVSELCEADGIDCPMEAFAWLKVDLAREAAA
jgi:hypothetical protein